MDEKDPERFRKGFKGGHLMGIPFQCDLCVFRDLNYRDPIASLPKDSTTLVAIRRLNLDAMWAREPETARNNLSRIRRDCSDALTLFSMVDPLPYLPTHSVGDRLGYKAALMTLAASLRPGRYRENVQYGTARKTSSWVGNVHDASSLYDGRAINLREKPSEKEDKFLSSSPTSGKWFRRFMQGMKLRMGELRFQNEPLTSAMLLAMDVHLEKAWRSAPGGG